ncbi:disulfide oxidoreductase [Burkholderia gladioli]|uniref:Disulfide oxidoreductase n=1 Tax=Burkholderia gladioli TaxID=28095 RepID=A0A2A7SA33_BURGA|nr:thioredoxin domain-containing protein [Burkholderia gladioli]PEH40426.1 disulfide oxidoreductase [Burkholderia gladioli]
MINCDGVRARPILGRTPRILRISRMRKIAGALVVSALLGSASHATAQENSLEGLSRSSPDQNAVAQSVTPYMAIGDFAEDRGKVYMFFEFTCPYCQRNWQAFIEWGNTLPRSFRFVAVPLVTDDPSTRAAALAFYTVKALAPQRIPNFLALGFAAAQQGRTSMRDYARMMVQLGLTPQAIEAYGRTQELGDRLRRGLDLAQRYDVEATPSFGVGGQYQTNANFTNGDYALLSRLLSGLVSRQIEQHKDHS